ncbi:MAG: hypoxanthine phosphoribosyltransferase [Bacteroidales bacterium]|nr:hypoxanthine phosphoribosyltransferase [Bacteroidales bacterium]
MITVHDRNFKLYLKEEDIQSDVRRVAAEISRDLKDKNPLFCPTLTGSFMFMTDLARALDFDAETYFVKYSSYSGMNSTGVVKSELPFPQKCRGRHVVIVEDIVDTGITMDAMLTELQKMEPAGISIASYLFKPDSFKKNFKIDYIGRSIPNDFILGYGLDYDNFGRFYKDIYVVC